MPCSRVWTDAADMTILTMREEGQTWAVIGRSLGLSRNTVIERGRRLCAAAPPRVRRLAVERPVAEDANRAPLPAGHPLTWGLLTDAEYPESGGGGWARGPAMRDGVDETQGYRAAAQAGDAGACRGEAVMTETHC